MAGRKSRHLPADYDGNDFKGYGVAVQITDAGAAQEFIDKSRPSGDPSEDGSYEGVDYKVDADGQTVGIVGDLLVFGEDEPTFEAMVEASNGESLADRRLTPQRSTPPRATASPTSSSTSAA